MPAENMLVLPIHNAVAIAESVAVPPSFSTGLKCPLMPAETSLFAHGAYLPPRSRCRHPPRLRQLRAFQLTQNLDFGGRVGALAVLRTGAYHHCYLMRLSIARPALNINHTLTEDCCSALNEPPPAPLQCRPTTGR